MASTQLSIFEVADSERAKKTFYPTPEALARRLLEGLKWDYIESVLEPSAGKGDLARVCAGLRKQAGYNGYYPTSEYSWNDAIRNADIDCIEIDPALRAVLEQQNFRVIHDDFLTFETQKRYHLIAMNPPFDRGAAHLLHALDLMERGGEIRCILNAETLRNLYSDQRRELAKRLNDLNAEVEFVQDGFKDAERSTDVEIALVRVSIPMVHIDSSFMDEMRKAPTYKTSTVASEYADMVRYNEIDEWVNRHNYEVACGIRLIEEWSAMEPFILANPDGDLTNPILSLKVRSGGSDRDVTINEYIRQTRLKYWRAIFQHSTFTDKLTSNLLNDLHASVNKFKDYEFSAYNILTLIIRMNGKVAQGIEDTIIKLFDDWTARSYYEDSPNRHYYNGWKTNDCWRVGKKVIIPFYDAFDTWDKRFRAWPVISRFRDIEKVFDFLDSGRTDWPGTFGNDFKVAEATGRAKNLDTKYFTCTFYKKGTAHLVFKDLDLLEKFNLFASQRKGWLPPNFGKKHYDDMSAEEKEVIDSFQGREKYEEILRRADYYLESGSASQLLLGAPTT